MKTKRKTYPCDISRKQFQNIRPLLESVRKKTKPRTVDLYAIFNAVLYILKSGCQWRMLPSEYPNWKTVHTYFTIWRTPDESGRSILDACLKKISWRGPKKTGAEVLHELFNRRRAEREEY